MYAHNPHLLKTNDTFVRLSPPLSNQERTLLEKELIQNGPPRPIILWNNLIIDGYEEYGICQDNKIPFETETKQFNSTEDAIYFVCALQLEKRNISEEYTRYLLGKMYLADKIIKERIAMKSEKETKNTKEHLNTKQRPTQTLEEKYHLSISTVYRYGNFAIAIDEIFKKDIQIANAILSGDYKISHDTVVEISRLPKEKVKRIRNLFYNANSNTIRFGDVRLELNWNHRKPAKKVEPLLHTESASPAAIKQMPEFDPDAEISSLALTIPSWISSITRAVKATDFSKITPQAALRLQRQLLELNNTTNQCLITITENDHE